MSEYKPLSSPNTEPQLLLESIRGKAGRPATRICKRGHNKDNTGRRGSTCLVCYKLVLSKSYPRKGWAETPEARVRRIAQNTARRLNTKTIMREAKAVPCMDCGLRYSHWVMDFDHRDPASKYANVSWLAQTGRMAALKREMAKCDIVCANCHRERSHRQGF